jgi:1,4-dihydroxy-2-naphthoyl-CoA hydrolase
VQVHDVAAIQAILDPLLPGLLNLPNGSRTTTTDSSTKFIAAAAVHGKVIGESVALHRGSTTMVWQTLIKRADGKLCAVVTQTQLVIGESTLMGKPKNG